MYASKSFSLVLLLAGSVAAQAPAPKTLSADDVAQWQSLVQWSISDDGRWFASQVATEGGGGWLDVRGVDADNRVQVPGGGQALFRPDSEWIAYRIEPQRKDDTPLLALRHLQSGGVKTWEDIEDFGWTQGGALWAHFRKPEGREDGGSDLMVVCPPALQTELVANVSGHWAAPKGDRIAISTNSDGKRFGLNILDGSTNHLLWNGDGPVTRFEWSKSGDSVAWICGKPEGPTSAGFAWRSNSGWQSKVLGPGRALPGGSRISPDLWLQVSEDGTAVAVGLVPSEKKATSEGRVWHPKDRVLVSQSRQEAFTRGQCWVWRPSTDELGRLAEGAASDVQLTPDLALALVSDFKPYEESASANGTRWKDVFWADSEGGRKPVSRKTSQNAYLAPNGKWALVFLGKEWGLSTPADPTPKPAKSNTSFADPDWDRGRPAEPVTGPTWLADGTAVVHDAFDAWQIGPDGTARRLTRGKEDGIRHRLVKTGADDADLVKPVYFALLEDSTFRTGFALMNPGEAPKPLLLDDVLVTELRQVPKADRMVFRMQAFDKPSDAFVTNGRFEQAKPMTRLNPQQKDFAWGSSQLVRYRAPWGPALQGVLMRPAKKLPGKAPLVVSVYERESQGLNAYRAPTDRVAYGVQRLLQEGYWVLLPDIAYRIGEPGESARLCLEAAVAAAVRAAPEIDPAKIGLMGHSWGGYQTAYTVATSNKFACGVAGAPITDLKALAGGVYADGRPNDGILESEQGRMSGPWWTSDAEYERNSPLTHVRRLSKPLLLSAGESDALVPWTQSLAFYQAARRLGKDVVLLSYPGEGHQLNNPINQKDYGAKLRHFFDVHLMGKEPEPWLISGR